MRALALALMMVVTTIAPCSAQGHDGDNPISWIEKEKVRAAYHYANPPAAERVALLKRAGMNSMILKASVEKALPWLREAKKQGMRCFLALNFNVNAEEEGLRQAVLADGRVERYACPLDDRFWRDHLTPAIMERVALSGDPDLQVDGLWIDFELYSTVTGQRYYNNACYCDHCFGEFCKHKGIQTPKLGYAERAPWLKEQGYAEEYQPYLGERMEALATELREKIHAVNPNFLLGFYPTPHNWSLMAVARGFSTERVPILLWATDTYGGGGPARVPDDWRQEYADQGINARYLAGMLLRSYSAKNLAANIYQTTDKCDGYWLFTTYTLWTPPREKPGDYYLAAGEPEDYWDAITLANSEIDKRLQQGEGYETDLTIGPEPVVYRPLTQPDKRKQLHALVAPEITGEVVEYPKVKLRGSNMMVVACRAGQPVEIALGFQQVGKGADAISWELIAPNRMHVLSGHGEQQHETAISFTPQQDGIYFLLVTAGGSCYYPLRSNAPLGLYAGARLHTMHGAARLYFKVPDGLGEFTILGEGSSGHEPIRVDVYNPDGEMVATGQSNQEETEALITVPVGEHAGETWSLAITKADVEIFEDTYITLPPPLPPVLSLVPEQVFDVRTDL